MTQKGKLWSLLYASFVLDGYTSSNVVERTNRTNISTLPVLPPESRVVSVM